MLFPSILTVGFFLLLEVLFTKPDTVVWLGPLSFTIYLLILYVASHNWSIAILVNMLLLSSFFFLPNAPAGVIRHVFILVFSLLFFAVTFRLRKVLRAVPSAGGEETSYPQSADVLILSFAVLFLWFSGLYNIFLSSLIPIYGSELISFLAIILMGITAGTYVHTMMTFPGSRRKALWALSLGVIMSEAGWAIAFLPFSYLTLGALLFIIYYVLWDILYRHEFSSLTKRILLQDILFLLVGGVVLLAFTPWLPR